MGVDSQQRVRHMNRDGQLVGTALQYIGEILSCMLSSGEEQSDPASFSYVTTPEEKFGDHARVHGRTFCILDEGRTGVESFLLSAGLRAEITASDSGSATARG